MSSGSALSRLRHIGWRGALPSASVARVVAQHRAGYEVHDGSVVSAVQPAGHFLKRGLDPSLRPAVGDFVELDGGGEVVEITRVLPRRSTDRKSTRLNSSHVAISYAVFCLEK